MATAAEVVTGQAGTPSAEEGQKSASEVLYGANDTSVEASQGEPDQQAGDQELNPDVNDVELEPIAPPKFLSAEEIEKFSAMPREAQEFVARKIGDSQKFADGKAAEAARTRQTVEGELRGHVMQLKEQHAEALSQYAQMLQVPEPDIRLLQSGDEGHRALFYQQDAAYRASAAQQQALQRQIAQAKQDAEAVRQRDAQLRLEQSNAILSEKIPEWSDPTARAALLPKLESAAAALGYPKERLQDADATDLLALHTYAKDRDDAEKWRKLQKDKMVNVRAAKQLPPVTQPGVSGGAQRQQTPKSAAEILYPNDVRKR